MIQSPVLIVIDVQKGFHEPKWGNRNNPGAEKNIQKLLTHWRDKKWPVYHIQHASDNPDSPLHPDNSGFEIMDEVKPIKGEPLIRKKVNSAFIGTDLATMLRAGSYEALVIAGLTTNHCVSTTTRMAGNIGFVTYLADDATAAFDRTDHKGDYYSAEEIHKISLANVHGEFATVLSTEQLLSKFQQ